MPTLYDQVGGETKLSAVVRSFYGRVTADPDLAPFFVGIDMDRLEAHQRSFLAAALGGPELFTGRPLEEAHAGLGVVDDDFDRVVDHLATALADLGSDAVAVAAVRKRLEGLRTRIVR